MVVFGVQGGTATQSSLSRGRLGCCATPAPKCPKIFEKFSMFINGKNAQVRSQAEQASLWRVSITTASAVYGRAAQRCVFSVVASNRNNTVSAIEKVRRACASERGDLLLW